MSGALPRSRPSEQGVDPRGVLAYLDAAARSEAIDLHSFLLVRHGQVVAEGHWAPYTPDRIQLLYSLSKSFTSTAIGIAVGEGLLSLDDPVTGFFPDLVPAVVPAYVAQLRVRHLLAMASGHATDTVRALLDGGPDWVRTFLSIPPDAEPGSLFCYNQGCTYTLAAILTRLTGGRVLDYLRPRLFEPLGITEAHWMQSPEGIDLGFTGLHVTAESIAKVGLLYLNGGRWQGAQVVPEAYVREATRAQVSTAANDATVDWRQGYGFQFWMSRHEAYRGDGAHGQLCVVIPEADAVVACTARVTDMQAEVDLIWDHLLPAFSDSAPQDAGVVEAEAELVERLGSLSTATIDGGPRPAGVVGTVSFAPTDETRERIDWLTGVRIEPGAEGDRLVLELADRAYPVEIVPGRWTAGEVPGIVIAERSLLPPVAATGGWTGPEDFTADLVFVASPHRLELRARSEGGRSTVDARWFEPRP